MLPRCRYINRKLLPAVIHRSIQSVTIEDRFWDSRERYRSFCAVTTEKRNIGNAIVNQVCSSNAHPMSRISCEDKTPIFIYDAGMGDGRILNKVLKGMHSLYPDNPFVVVVKEVSTEDINSALELLGERFIEHPDTLLCLTRKPFSDINNSLRHLNESLVFRTHGRTIPLHGTSVIYIDRHLEKLSMFIAESGVWTNNTNINNEIAICRNDKIHMFKSIIQHALQEGDRRVGNYDLIIASHPFRNRASAAFKCGKILLPLAKDLNPGGSLVVVHSTGDCPAMDLFPCLTRREFPLTSQNLIDTFISMQKSAEEDYEFSSPVDVRYGMNICDNTHTNDTTLKISASFVHSVWNCIAYVSQLGERDARQIWNEQSADICKKIESAPEIWFSNDMFTITRK